MKNTILLVLLALCVNMMLSKHSSHSRKHKRSSKQDEAHPIVLDQKIDAMEEYIGKTDVITYDMFKKLMKNRGMIPGEIQFVFNTADRTKINKLKQIDWQSFYLVFVVPFEACDEDKNWQLSKDEFAKCLESDELKDLKLTADDVAKVLELTNHDDDNLVTFSDYLYFRRVNIGWGDCAGGVNMSRIKIPCGMKVVVPGFIATEQDVKMIMEVVTAFKSGRTYLADPYLHLLDFIQTSFIYYYFYAFQVPYFNGMVNKGDMVRAIDYQMVTVGMNNGVIDQIFGDATELSLKYFAVSMIVFQNFRRFAKVSQWGLNEEEFLLLLKQETFSSSMLSKIDNIYIPTMEEYTAASAQPEIAYHERDFLVTFLQTGYKQKKHSKNLSKSYLKNYSSMRQKNRLHKLKHAKSNNNKQKTETMIKQASEFTDLTTDEDMENHLKHLRFRSKKDDESYDEDKQKVIYRQFEYKNKGVLKFPQFLRLFKFMWLFINYDSDLNSILTFQEIRNGIESYDPPLMLSLEETQWLQWSSDFVANPVLDSYDLKQWFSMSMFHDVFQYYKQSAFTSFISEPKLLMAMYQLGYRTTEYTLTASKQGRDPTNDLPLYNYWTAFKSGVREEIICQKQHVYEEIKAIVDETVK